MKQIALFCPSCDAFFWNVEKTLMRMGTVPQEDCRKCLLIQAFCRGDDA